MNAPRRAALVSTLAAVLVAISIDAAPAPGDDSIPALAPAVPEAAPAPERPADGIAIPAPGSNSPPPAAPANAPPCAPQADAPPEPPPAPPAPSLVKAPVPRTLQEIDEAYDDREKEAAKAVRRLRYDAVLEYVAARPKARDIEDARAQLVRLALLVEDWRSTLERADEYLSVYPAGKYEVDARSGRAEALAKLGRVPEAHAAYETLTRAANLARHGQGAVVSAWTSYARWLEKIGDVESARGAWRGLKAATASSQSAAAVAYMADDQMKALDLLGREPAPFPADARDLSGRGVSLPEYRGRVLLVDFWATWCSPCVAEMPEIVSAYERFRDQGFEVVGVAIDVATEGARVRDFVAKNAIPWRTVHHPGLWNVKSVPHTVLIGRDGRVVRVGARGRDLVREIGRLVAAR